MSNNNGHLELPTLSSADSPIFNITNRAHLVRSADWYWLAYFGLMFTTASRSVRIAWSGPQRFMDVLKLAQCLVCPGLFVGNVANIFGSFVCCLEVERWRNIIYVCWIHSAFVLLQIYVTICMKFSRVTS